MNPFTKPLLPSSKPTFAVVYTAKNEASFLSLAIPYYLSQGASMIYLFLDNCTDNTSDILSKYPNLEIRRSVSPSDFLQYPSFLSFLVLSNDMDHRKVLNTYFAVQRASLLSIDWLFCIDADEFIVPTSDTISDSLPLANQHFEQLLIRNYELLPTHSDLSTSIFDQVYFLNRHNLTSFIWRVLNRLLRPFFNSNFLAALQHFIYLLVNYGIYPRIALNPITDKPIYFSHFMAYNNHKSVIRVKDAFNYLFNIHDWIPLSRIRRPLTTSFRGKLLHYYLPSLSHFRTKFTDLGKDNIRGDFHVRNNLANIALSTDSQLIDQFYASSICVERPIIDALIRRGLAFKEDSISLFYKSLNLTPNDRLSKVL